MTPPSPIAKSELEAPASDIDAIDPINANIKPTNTPIIAPNIPWIFAIDNTPIFVISFILHLIKNYFCTFI